MGVYNLRAIVILWVVDKDSSFSLHIAGLEVVHHPEAVVEETLVVVVKEVVLALTVGASRVRVTCFALGVCPHVGKPDIIMFLLALFLYFNANEVSNRQVQIKVKLIEPGVLVVDEPREGGVVGGWVPDAQQPCAVCRLVIFPQDRARKVLSRWQSLVKECDKLRTEYHFDFQLHVNDKNTWLKSLWLKA